VVVIAGAGCSSSAKHIAAAPGAPTGSTTTTLPPVTGPLTRASERSVSLLFTQGVARVPNGWIFSNDFGLYRTDDALRIVAHTDKAIPAAWSKKGYNHVGDIDVVGKYVYAPFEEPDYSRGTQAMARFDRVTLRFVDAVTVPQHQNSFVTVDTATMTAYTMDQCDGDTLLRYDVANGWKPLPPLRMRTTLHRTQGADIGGGGVWISTDDAVKGVYRVDLATGAVARVAKMGHADGGEGEGIDVTDLPGGYVHTLVAEAGAHPSWFQHWHASS